MTHQTRIFVLYNLAFGPQIAVINILVALLFLRSFQDVLPVAIVAIPIAAVVGMLPVAIHLVFMLPLRDTMSARAFLLVSPFSGYIATTTSASLLLWTPLSRNLPSIFELGCFGILPALCCGLLALKFQGVSQKTS
jgi:hypothetical protein